MKIDRVSIIVPTLNEEKLIEGTLLQYDDKLKDQYNLEIIISDGGSNDATLERINGKCDLVIKKEPVKKQNISQGRNKGAENSGGDVLIFFNADTRVLNMRKFLNDVLNVLMTGKYIAVSFKIKVFPEEELISDKIFHTFYNNYVRIINKIGIGMARGECHVILRKYFELAGGYNENLIAGEDFDLYRRVRKFGKIFYCSNPVVYESPRRYRAYGYLRVFLLWAKNAIWIVMFNKSFQKTWDPVR